MGGKKYCHSKAVVEPYGEAANIIFSQIVSSLETALNVSKVSKTHKNTQLSSYHSLKIVENSSECIVEHVDLIDTIQNHH